MALQEKKTAAAWVKNEFKSVWITNLIETAENWDYSKEMFLKDKTIDFIKFTIGEIKKTKFYQEMYFSS